MGELVALPKPSPKFRVGETVFLNSSGQAMTVTAVGPNARFDLAEGEVYCEWLVEGDEHERIFPQEALRGAAELEEWLKRERVKKSRRERITRPPPVGKRKTRK